MTVEIGIDEETGTKLTKTATYSNGTKETNDGITITNKYIDFKPIHWYDDGSDGDGSIKQDPPIKKAIELKNGKEPSEEQEFTFTMTGKDEAPLPPAVDGVTTYDEASNTLTAKLSTKDALKGIEFGNIEFTLDDVDKTYEYTIKEVKQDIKNYTFDETATGNGYTMTVEIGIEGTELTKTVTYSGGEGATEGGITITNTYTGGSKGSSGGGSGSSGGGSGSSTGKHAVNPVNANQTTGEATGELTGDNGDHIDFVEPKPDSNRYKNWIWGLMPKTGEDAARMGAMLLAMAGLIAVIAAVVFRKKQKK